MRASTITAFTPGHRRVAPRARLPLASRSMPPADPAEAVELLHRQLMELEVLEAMYPREGDARWRCSIPPPRTPRSRGGRVGILRRTPTDAVLRAIPPLRAALLHVPGGDGDDRGAVTSAPPSPTGILTRPRLELSASILPATSRLASSSSARSPTNTPPCATTARSV